MGPGRVEAVDFPLCSGRGVSRLIETSSAPQLRKAFGLLGPATNLFIEVVLMVSITAATSS